MQRNLRNAENDCMIPCTVDKCFSEESTKFAFLFEKIIGIFSEIARKCEKNDCRIVQRP